MFGFLKNFLRRPEQTAVETGGADFSETCEEPQYADAAQVETSNHSAQPPRASRPASVYANGAGAVPRPVNRGMEVRLQPVLDSLPLELQPRLLHKNAGDSCIYVPLEKILSQLSRGAVRITFGELRQAAPNFFSQEADRDKTPVALPLNELIANLNPALISRRRVQRQIEVPADIVSPFDPQTNGLAFTMASAAPEPAAPAFEMPRQAAETALPTASGRNNPIDLSPKPAAPENNPMPAAPALSMPRGPINFSLPSHASKPPQAAPKAPAPAPIASVQAPVPVKAAPEPDAITVNLLALAEVWPDAVRAEIVHLNLIDAKVALPVSVIEQALKQGRIAFSWKTLRSYIKSGGVPSSSPQDGVVLELPLKVVAPIFLARQSESSKDKRKVSIDAEIPNLFFGLPQAESPNAVTKPQDTNYYIWDDSSDTARVSLDEVKRKSVSPGTAFIARYATPNEVASRAAALEGVAGALIALPDGLMVASCLSTDLNGDTLAAFLPQIFAKVTQCTRELRMGELNNLNFTVGNVPWKIFRVNAIFFAAFGRAGQSLPTAQLAALAGELDHKAK
jgi:predicted regulator of Ras-like GTPase activity (Roadblock/LC7/MglB family)